MQPSSSASRVRESIASSAKLRPGLRFGSICSGIGGAEVAWTALGWRSAWCAEIDPFASAVLAARFPDTPNHGDFTRIGREVDGGTVDVLVGGTPCQAFSVAGKRAGLDDPRGNLTLEFLGLVGRLLPRWVVWENVPGVLSIDGGRTFGTVLGLLGELGYGFAYRILDAQYFGLAQRRRRVFVVAYRGDWRPPAAVLFEPESVCGDSAPRRETGARVAGTLTGGSGVRGWSGDNGGGQGCELVTVGSLTARHGKGPDSDCTSPLVAYQQHGSDVGEAGALRRGRGDVQSGVPFVATYMADDYKTGSYEATETARPLTTSADRTRSAPLALTPFDPKQIAHPANWSNPQPGDPCHPMRSVANAEPAIATSSAVRRLTPRECERLQGFPDDWTLIDGYNSRRTGEYGGNRGVADGPRYRALGNAFPVPVVRWIGERIALCDGVLRDAGQVAA